MLLTGGDTHTAAVLPHCSCYTVSQATTQTVDGLVQTGEIMNVCVCVCVCVYIQAVFCNTRLSFQHKNEHLVTVFAFRLHTNNENAYSKWRILNLETYMETLKTDT